MNKKKKDTHDWDYIRIMEGEIDEKKFMLLMVKIIQSKALTKEDSIELVRLYIKHLKYQFYGADFASTQEKMLNSLLRDMYIDLEDKT